MPYIDPIKVVRNSQTLAAYRSWRREGLARALPWLLVAVAAAMVEAGVFLYGLFHNSLRELFWIGGMAWLVFGVSFAIGSLRVWLFQRAHPLELP